MAASSGQGGSRDLGVPSDWLEPAMAANGIGSFDWDIRADRLTGDERALRILGLLPDPDDGAAAPRPAPAPGAGGRGADGGSDAGSEAGVEPDEADAAPRAGSDAAAGGSGGRGGTGVESGARSGGDAGSEAGAGSQGGAGAEGAGETESGVAGPAGRRGGATGGDGAGAGGRGGDGSPGSSPEASAESESRAGATGLAAASDVPDSRDVLGLDELDAATAAVAPDVAPPPRRGLSSRDATPPGAAAPGDAASADPAAPAGARRPGEADDDALPADAAADAATAAPVAVARAAAGAAATAEAAAATIDPDGPALTAAEFLDMLDPADADTVRRRVGRAVRDLGQCGAYYRTRLPGGHSRAVRFRGRVLADEQGNATHMVGFVWDATAELHKRERVDRSAADREARTLFIREAARALSEAVTSVDVARVFTELPLPGIAPDGLVLAGLENGRIQSMSATGYPAPKGLPHDHVPLDADHPAAQALRTRTPVFLSSREEYRERFPAAWPKIVDSPRASWAFLPLVASGRSLGVCLVSFDHAQPFADAERTLLSTLGGMAAQSLARARLHDAELELAAGLQRVLLPRRVPPVVGFETAVRYLPSGTGLQIGGDWYDVVPLPGGNVAVVIGDVQGHDVHAAGVMGQLRIALRAYAAEGHPPAAVMTRASRFLADLDTGHFATCLYAEVSADYGAVYAARAGHLDPMVRRADGTARIQEVAGGLPLGIAPELEYPVTRFSLDPGEILLLCTDGLVEDRHVDLDVGIERLRQALERGRPNDLGELVDYVSAGAAESHERDDDIALLVLRWDGPADGRRREQLRRRISQADLARIAEVRAELREAVRRWGVDDLLDSVELLSTELITNALVHTDRDAVLTARLQRPPGPDHEPARLRIEVEDESDQWPKRRTPGEQASSGRGLMLVEAMADDWGVDPRGSGKRLWFELVSHAGEEGAEAPLPADGAAAAAVAGLGVDDDLFDESTWLDQFTDEPPEPPAPEADPPEDL